MKTASIIFVLLAFLLSFVCTAQEVQQNPFMEMADKKYIEYSVALEKEYQRLFPLDTLELQNFIRQIEEVAKITGR